jgi:hypothetical protein
MLLRVTTHGQRVIYHVVSATPSYEETRITLPAGTYNFRDHPNPLRSDWGKWLVLDESELPKLGLDSDAIVGMSHEALMFCGSPACISSMAMDIEDITPVMATVQSVVTAEVKTAKIIPLPVRRYPEFTRNDQPRGLYCASRHRRFLNPAARRECHG